MGFREEACDYIQNTAREVWANRQDNRDDYVPRTVEPYKEEDSQEEDSLFRRPSFEDDSLINQDRVAVIGSSASGKSYLIDHVYGQSLDRFVEREGKAPFPIYVNCSGGLPGSNSIAEAIRLRAAGELCDRISSEHRPGIHLFLDEVDTRLRHDRDASFRFELIKDLKRIEEEVGNLRLMLTSRRREWERLSELGQKVRAGGIPAFQFPSRPSRRAYEHLIPDDERLEKFFTLCYQRGFRDLLDLPMEGFEFARTFEETGELPESRDRLQLIDRLINERLVKSDSEDELTFAPSRRRLRYLAGLLACISFFTERRAWSVRDAIDDLGETALVGEIQPVTPAEVKWLIQSRLFHSIDKNQYVFANDRFREVLAAETLAQLKPRKQQSLLRAGHVRGRSRVIPAARSVAINLATLDSRYHAHFLAAEPEIAAFSSYPRLKLEDEQGVIEQLVVWGRDGHHPPWTELEGVGVPARIALVRHKDALTADFVLQYLNSRIPMERLWGVVMGQYTAVEFGVSERLLDIACAECESTGIRKRALKALEAADAPYADRIEPLLQHDNDEIRGYALTAWRKLRDASPSEYVERLDELRSEPSLSSRLLRDPRRYAQTLTSEQVTEAFEALGERYRPGIEQAWPLGMQRSTFNKLHESLLSGLFRRTSKLDDVEVPADLVVDFLTSNGGYPTDSESVVEMLTSSPQRWEEALAEVLSRDEDGIIGTSELSRNLARSAPDDFEDRTPSSNDLPYIQVDFIQQIRSAIARLRSEEYPRDFSLDPLFGSTAEDRALPEQPILSDEEPLPAHVDREVVQERVRAVLDEYDSAQERARALVHEFWRINAGGETSSPVPPLRVTSLKPSRLSQLIDCLSDLQSEVVDVLCNGLPELASEPVARPTALYLLKRGESVQAETASDVLIHSDLWDDDSRSEVEMRLLDYLRELDRKVWKCTIDHLMTNRSDARSRVLRHLIEVEDEFYVQTIEYKLRAADFTSRPEWCRMVDYVKAHVEDGLTDILVAAFLAAETKADLLKDDRATENVAQGAVSQYDLLGLLVDIIENGDERGWILLDDRLSLGTVPLQRTIPGIRIPMPRTPGHLSILSRWYRDVRVAHDDSAVDEDQASDHSSVAHAIMDTIIKHGSYAAVEAVFSLQKSDEFADAQWLSSKCLDVIDEYLINQAASYSIQELLEFILTDLFHLIRSEGDLFEVLLQILEDLQCDFEEGRAVAGFWNPVSEKNDNYSAPDSETLTRTEEPKDETDCQNVLWGLVRPRLRAYGVTDIEESFVTKNRVDLRLDHVEAGRRSKRVFLELKVAHEGYDFKRDTQNDLFDPIENQLWEKYLRPTGVKHGIYVVIWPKDPERYAWPRSSGSYGERYDSSGAFQKALEERAKAVNEEHGVSIETVVLDITTEHR